MYCALDSAQDGTSECQSPVAPRNRDKTALRRRLFSPRSPAHSIPAGINGPVKNRSYVRTLLDYPMNELRVSNDLLLNPAGLRSRAAGDGYLFFRGLIERDAL